MQRTWVRVRVHRRIKHSTQLNGAQAHANLMIIQTYQLSAALDSPAAVYVNKYVCCGLGVRVELGWWWLQIAIPECCVILVLTVLLNMCAHFHQQYWSVIDFMLFYMSEHIQYLNESSGFVQNFISRHSRRFKNMKKSESRVLVKHSLFYGKKHRSNNSMDRKVFHSSTDDLPRSGRPNEALTKEIVKGSCKR